MYMLSCFVLLLIVCVSAQNNERKPMREMISWDEYREMFPNLHFSTDAMMHFESNVKYILSHSHSFELGVTPFMHLSDEEFSSMFSNITVDHQRNEKEITFSLRASSSKDWVTDGCVTPVKDQGQCGSCWSFSTSGVMEGANCVKTGKLISLSEQQLVSCANKLNQGCNGGNVDWTFRYLESNEHCSEADYPYVSGTGTVPSCHSCKGVVSKVSEFVDVKKGDEDQLMKAVQLMPVAVAIEADQKEFQLYKSGIMDFSCGNKLDHAVLLVGYGTENGVDYWKVKNSWSTSWGEGGFFRLKRGVDMCGIADSASYPIL